MVTQAEFEYAKDKVLMGTERRSMAMTDEEKTLTAYHEAGHALVAMHVPKSDPLHKVTIIPRGRALGVTMQLPERDHLSHTKQFLESRLAIMFGGISPLSPTNAALVRWTPCSGLKSAGFCPTVRMWSCRQAFQNGCECSASTQ